VHRDGVAEFVAAFDLAEELGDVVGLGQSLASSTRAALVEVVRPMTRRPVAPGAESLSGATMAGLSVAMAARQGAADRGPSR
jgi:hypothetical protein